MTMRQLVLDMGLAPVPSLENFVAGRNAGLLEHLRVWSRNPMRSPVPTFIWGGAGSGKSHLLHLWQARHHAIALDPATSEIRDGDVYDLQHEGRLNVSSGSQRHQDQQRRPDQKGPDDRG